MISKDIDGGNPCVEDAVCISSGVGDEYYYCYDKKFRDPLEPCDDNSNCQYGCDNGFCKSY